MRTMAVSDARENLADLVGEVRFAGQRVELTKHGRTVAYVVSREDFERLSSLDTVQARRAAEVFDAASGETISLARDEQPAMSGVSEADTV